MKLCCSLSEDSKQWQPYLLILLSNEDSRDKCEPLYGSLSEDSKVCLLMLSTGSNRCRIYLCCCLLTIIKTPIKPCGSLFEDCMLHLSMLSTEGTKQCSTYLRLLLSTKDSRDNCETIWFSF